MRCVTHWRKPGPIQIIKGWLDENGKTQERIYDVAVSDGRNIGADGRCKTPVGNTVDVATASFTNTIGASELGTVWTDPDFDPGQKAFYYARSSRYPTPRWTTIDAFRFGVAIPEVRLCQHRNVPIHHRSGIHRENDKF